MSNRVLKKMDKKSILIVLLVLIFAAETVVFLKTYFHFIDLKAEAIVANTNVVFKAKKNSGEEGFNQVDIKKDLTRFLDSKKKTKPTSFTYEIEDEDFYFEISVTEIDNGYAFSVDKVVDTNKNINARMNFVNVETILFQTGNNNSSTVVKLVGELDSKYLVLTNGANYFLGVDVGIITFMDNQFYYLSYNSKYNNLKEAESCTKEVKNSIENFNGNEYYYKYGKIFFLDDYYQKLASKTYTVNERCEELNTISNEKKLEG